MAEHPTFGQWLRSQRRERDLAQDALSREIGCAQVTIRKIEADQLRPPRQMAELFVEKLGVPLKERKRFIDFARSGIYPFEVLENLPPNNLPHALTSFIGRTSELDEVDRLLGSSRLLTLTGAGGIGKTRLALQTAASEFGRYLDGVWLVELAALADPDLVPQVVAGTLGLQNSGKGSYESILILHLAHKHTLIVFDNCEHVLDACAQLALTLLQSCPKLTILATSREQLGVTGEVIFRVSPLTALDPGMVANHEDLQLTDSVHLFVERAAAVLPGFKPTREMFPVIARICYRLDGIPMAIELAFAWSVFLLVYDPSLEGYLNLIPKNEADSRPAARYVVLPTTFSYRPRRYRLRSSCHSHRNDAQNINSLHCQAKVRPPMAIQ
jgi:transcriptional regulator with XRE-family HTH domain